jgi:hypothetical protein
VLIADERILPQVNKKAVEIVIDSFKDSQLLMPVPCIGCHVDAAATIQTADRINVLLEGLVPAIFTSRLPKDITSIV